MNNPLPASADDFSNAHELARYAATIAKDGRYDEAEALLQEGVGKFSDNHVVLVYRARLAEEQGHEAVAYDHYSLAIKYFPQDIWLYRRAANCLRLLKRFNEADTLLTKTMQLFPENIDLLSDYAINAESSGNAREAYLRFQLAIDRSPENWWLYRRAAICLRAMGDFDASDKILSIGIIRFPAERAMYSDYATTAESRGAWKEAAQRRAIEITRFPHSYDASIRYAVALRFAAEPKASELELIKIIAEFPNEARPLSELAWLLWILKEEERSLSVNEVRSLIDHFMDLNGISGDLWDARANLDRLEGRFSDFLERANIGHLKFPTHVALKKSLSTARGLMLGVENEVDQISINEISADILIDDGTRAVAAFESLGGTAPEDFFSPHGCEFGLIQRALLLEPLGLLRWSSISERDLIVALEEKFERIGRPETTEIVARGCPDWGLIDKAYNFRADHTNLAIISVKRDEARGLMCRQMSFLSRKLREDLEDGEKIFVYRRVGDHSELEASQLALAVNKYGRNTLLYVTRATHDDPAFSVKKIHEGFLMGYLDWFSPEKHNNPKNVEGWSKLCVNAYKIWRKTSP